MQPILMMLKNQAVVFMMDMGNASAFQFFRWLNPKKLLLFRFYAQIAKPLCIKDKTYEKMIIVTHLRI